MLDDIKTPEDKTQKDNALNTNYMAVKEPPKTEETTIETESTKKRRRVRNITLTNKQKTLLGLGAVIILVGSFIGGILLASKKPTQQPEAPVAQQPAEPPKTTVTSKLTGLEVTPEAAQNSVTGVMIENSPDARPQSGLKDAGVVYEAVAEGGITRFLAVFQDTVPEYIGPVRSVRPYYLDLLGPYNAAIAHVGGSSQALAEIRSQNIKDLDQFSVGTKAFWRENSRFAPHNVYTNMAKLKEVEKEKGWTPGDFQGFSRGGSGEASATPTARSVTIRMSSTLYNVAYQWDQTSNTYLRNVGGKPHLDAKSNTQLAPKVLIVPIVARSQSGVYSVYNLTAGGKVFIFQNGTVTEGTWSKAGRTNQFVFTGSDGQPIKIAPGQTWVTLAAAAPDVAFTP